MEPLLGVSVPVVETNTSVVAACATAARRARKDKRDIEAASKVKRLVAEVGVTARAVVGFGLTARDWRGTIMYVCHAVGIHVEMVI